MSLYGVQKLLFHLNNETRVARRFESERDALLAEYELSATESAAIKITDIGAL